MTAGRNKKGQFVKGSKLAKTLGKKGHKKSCQKHCKKK